MINMYRDTLNEEPKKDIKEIIDDILKLVDDAGYGITRLNAYTDVIDRTHNINIEIVRKPIIDLRPMADDKQ